MEVKPMYTPFTEPPESITFVVGTTQYKYRNNYYFMHLLNYTADMSNDAVFDALGIDKDALAQELWGYPPDGGDWPQSYGENYKEDTAKLAMYLLRRTGQILDINKEYQEGELTPEVQTYDIY